ncbi:DNA alkylation repair protein [Flagellimonas pacifica]|uniref:3-methyladenine DNA glycosylase AlkC n=1 Tax=Flagellimonas pacifica TaxID=1247520 RepID=A0A285MS88_9FLAO|nr:DNA alkylation repair protein [Allomuricauda parva]SNZ00035.1 3-methyladenine DNA glycosylase AlkC [Allomuricauda parva]
MAELFKNIYNPTFFSRFTVCMEEVFPKFDTNSFLKEIYNDEWDNKELKQRMRHITHILNDHLTNDFECNVEMLLKLIPILKQNDFRSDNLEFIFLPDFVEVYGTDDYNISINAFEEITKFVSCEFAVRPFIIDYPKKMIQQMIDWSHHEHPMVRRLASEGCRPRLPWAMALPHLKKDPAPILPILERLKSDTSESVRRSVANNLNDISKDNPDIVIRLAKKWKGKSKELDWVVKHACRTLLKQGIPQVMRLFGFGKVGNINIKKFEIQTPTVSIGGDLKFSFVLKNANGNSTKIRLEYGLYYQKANGTLSKKVFKISEKEYAGGSSTEILRKQPFKIITTRKFHVGHHQVSLIINGIELEKKDFQLIEK